MKVFQPSMNMSGCSENSKGILRKIQVESDFLSFIISRVFFFFEKYFVFFRCFNEIIPFLVFHAFDISFAVIRINNTRLRHIS